MADVLAEAGTAYASADEAGDEPAAARAAQYIRERIAEIDMEDLAEVLFRVTVAYGSARLSTDDD